MEKFSIPKERNTWKNRINLLVTKEKAAPLIDEWTAKMALRALFTNTQVDSGLPTTSQMFDIQSTEADTTTVTDHTSTVANTKVVGSSEDTECCSTNEVKNAINDNMPVSEVDLTPDKASHDLAVNNILQNCQSDITPFSLPEGFCRTNSQLPNEASLSTAARTFKPLKCPECQSNVRLVNKYRLDKLWKVECRNIACLKQIALVPYDKDYAEQLKTLYERYLKGVSYCHRKEKCKSKVGNKENKKSGIHKNTLDEVFDEETDENGNVYLWCPGQEEKVILF